MFEASSALVRQIDQKQIAFQGKPTEHLRLGFADFLQVGDQLRLLERRFSPYHHLVRDAGRLEMQRAPRADLEGAVDQFVIISRHPLIVLAAQRAERVPTGRRIHADPVLGIAQRFRIEKHGGPVEKAMGAVQVAGAHGQFVRVDPVLKSNRLSPGGDLKGSLVLPLQGQRLPLRAGRSQVLQVAGELPHQVASRSPYRQRYGE